MESAGPYASLLQTDNHASTPPLCFYRPDALPAAQPTVSKHRSKSRSSNKPVFSFLRQLTTWRCPHLLLNAVLWLRRRCCCWAPAHAARRACCSSNRSIDIFCRPGAQQQTRRNSVWRANNGTDGRTDKRTDRRTSDRYIDSAACYASSINNPSRLKPRA